jgi:hypothetical protein
MTTLISVTLARRAVAILAPLPESLIYRSAWGYGLAMRVLYGRYYAARDAAVAVHIPDGASVLELCCGPARLYLRELRGRIGSYVALDASACAGSASTPAARTSRPPTYRTPTSSSCRRASTSSCPTPRRSCGACAPRRAPR